ncbi:MAG: CHC2 zinc finger domain-containing protein [Actinobacteria bacterium]|nr:CHC2 zinc finger domain-containing protein [Actinomycetota bacterium]
MNKSLKEGEINTLKSRADIQSIVSGYVNLKKSGKNYLGLCPFHKEKTPSFSVDTRRQLYHCFGCGEGGDVISFIMKVENIDFVEAAEFLAKKVNYNLQFIHAGSPEASEKRSRLVELNELARKYYNFVFFKSKKAAPARSYLIKRGFKKETLQLFEVGFSIDSWENFADFAKKRGFTSREIVDCGLAIESTGKTASDIYDRFRGRIMFPIKDLVGKTIGFGGRIIPERQVAGSEQTSNLQADKQKTSNLSIRQAKYINTPETKLYSKSRNIYGLFEAKNSIVDSDEALIVEGYTDVMALRQSEVKNAVASLGTALTTEQIELLGRFTKNIVLVFDSDTAGVNASLKGIERLREYNEKLDLFHDSNINIKVAVLESGYDPADYVIKNGKDKFQDKLKKAATIIDFTIEMILKKYNISDLNEKLAAADELLKFTSSLSSKIVQEECVKKIALKLNLKENLLVEQMLKKSHIKKDKTYSASNGINDDYKETESISPFKNIEIEALKIIINGIGSKFENLLDIGPEYFKFDDTRKIYEAVKAEIKVKNKKGQKLNFPIEISSDNLEKEDEKKLYNLILFSSINYTDNDLASLEVFNNLKKIYISDQIEEIKKQLSKLENYSKEFNKQDLKGQEIKDKGIRLENKIRELSYKLNELEQEKRNYILSN